MTEIAGYLSGIFILLSFLPYIKGIFKHETKPERASWLIWSILGGISFFSQLAKGASDSLWLAGVQTFGDLFIFLIAIKYGIGGLLKRDILALIGAGLSLVLWYFTKEPVVALFIVIFIDALGVVLTIIKTRENPSTEPMSAWILTGLAGFFAMLAVGKLNFVLLSFPTYILLASLALILTIKLGAARNKTPK